MKRYLLLLISLVIILSAALSSCSVGEATRESELKTSLEDTYEDLSSTFSGSTGQYSLVSEYLKSWANKNELEITENHEHYMIITNHATEGCEDTESIVLQCSVETDNFNNSMQPLAIALSSLLGPERHGNISLIITENDNGEYIGASSVNTKYYDTDNFINIRHNDGLRLYTAGAYEMKSHMSASIDMTSPSYTHAYAITMSNSGYKDPYDFENNYPNPIETIGSLLATEKSSGQLFQLASFECESQDGYMPTSATAVVVVDGNDVSSFTKKFNSSYNNVKKKFEKLEDNFVYTLTETSMPSQVITNQASDNIISLMYTLHTGIYLQDEESGDIISSSDVSYVSTSNGALNLDMTSRSSDKSVLNEMAAEFLTTSGLCDINYISSDPVMTWSCSSGSTLSTFLSDALGAEESIISSTLESSECDIFYSNREVNMVSYRCNIHSGDAAMMNIIHFMESLVK